MKYLSSKEIRDIWLKFFESKGHYILPSESLIPINDPSLLWINSGIATLKPYFEGRAKPPSPRLTNSQKAIRTGDIDNVGITSRHHTFFEMLGNFSIGNYFKKEAIEFAWELLTSKEWFGIDKDLLYVTVYLEDPEAIDYWLSVGIKKDRIFKMSRKTNFWDMGKGPCGPSSEIFFDKGSKYDSRSAKELIEKDIENDRYIEIWNIVFSEFNNDGNGNYSPLPMKNIDTGAGLERLVSAIQNKPTNFETDLFESIIKKIEEKSKFPYLWDYIPSELLEKNERQFNINSYYKKIADYMRTVCFAIADGALPEATGRGYIIRNLLRKAVLNKEKLEINYLFLYEIVEIVIETLSSFYPNIIEKKDLIIDIVKSEEKQFEKTLSSSFKKIKKEILNKNINDETIHKIHETYGLPFEFIENIFQENNKELLKTYSEKNLIKSTKSNNKVKTHIEISSMQNKLGVVLAKKSESEKAIEINPEDSSAYSNQGLFLKDLKRYDEAVKKFEKAIEINPEDSSAYSNWGLFLKDLKRYDEAVKKFEKAIEINPEDSNAYNNLGVVLGEKSEPEKAIKKFEKAIKINPEHYIAYYNWGNALRDLGKNDEAVKKFEKSIEKNPEDSSAYYNWGNALRDLGKNDEAVKKFEKAIEINPEDSNAYYNLGNALRDLGKNDEAVKKFEKAIEKNPEDSNAYYNWGISLSDLGKNDEAIEKYEKAIEKNPENSNAYNNLGVVLGEKSEPEKAIKKFEKAIEINSEDSIAYYNLGNALRDLGKNDEAVKKFEKAIEINPEDSIAYYNLGISLSDLGKNDEAIEKFEKAIEKNPENSNAYNNLGIVLGKKLEPEKAIKKFEKAIEINPEHSDAYFNWGISLGLLKKFSESTNKIEKAIEINPEYSNTKTKRILLLNNELEKLDFFKINEKHKEKSKKTKELNAMNIQEEIFIGLYKTDFLGYQESEVKSKVIFISGDKVVFDKTPFFATSGGQESDFGKAGEYKVEYVEKNAEKTFIHLIPGHKFNVGDEVLLSIDSERRKGLSIHHTSTHLLFAAIEKITGIPISQQGAKTESNFLRFDFSYQLKFDEVLLNKIEVLVNQWIKNKVNVETKIMSLEEAKKIGASFLDKYEYSEMVRVVIIKDIDISMCGGTHVKNISEINEIVITKLEKRGSGIWRIEAIAGKENIKSAMPEINNKIKNDILDPVLNKVDLINKKIKELNLKNEINFDNELKELNINNSSYKKEIILLCEKIEKDVSKKRDEIYLNIKEKIKDDFKENNIQILKFELFDIQEITKPLLDIIDGSKADLGVAIINKNDKITFAFILADKNVNENNINRIKKFAEENNLKGNGKRQQYIFGGPSVDSTKLIEEIKKWEF